MFLSGEIVLQARKGQRGTKNTKDARVYILAASQDPIWELGDDVGENGCSSSKKLFERKLMMTRPRGGKWKWASP